MTVVFCLQEDAEGNTIGWSFEFLFKNVEAATADSLCRKNIKQPNQAASSFLQQ